ncbi:hypothetical protein JCM21900_005217 [Sporobolomyces salmonicolor]
MPSSSSRSTRSGGAANHINFPTSKRPSTSKSYKSATLLFRREVQSMLSTPLALPSHLPANAPVEVVACLERLSTSGMQQSVQLCRAGEEEWVTRTEGERTYFPRAGRVQKRARAAVEDEEEEEEGEDFEDAPVAAKKSKSSRRSSRRHGADHDPQQEPRIASSSARKAAPGAPKKKHRKSRHADDDDESFDDGASAETEQSHLGRRAPQNPGMLATVNEEEGGAIAGPGPSASSSSGVLGRGQRRCTGRTFFVKKEHDEADDLASLCGRVDGLDVRSTVDPESEWERTPMPTTTSLDDKGKGRA